MARVKRAISDIFPALSISESRFILEYLISGNGTQSVIAADLCDKSKPRQAALLAVHILKRPHVIEAIKEQTNASAVRNLITVDRLMQEVYRLATYNIQDAFDENGECKKITELSEDLARALEGFEVEEVRGRPGVTVTKFKFAKKSVSQQMLLEKLDAVVQRFEITGKNGRPLHSSQVDLSDVSIELLKKIVEKAQ